MSFSKATQILRLAAMCLGTRGGVTKQQIAERFETSTRTAERMIEALREVYGDSVETVMVDTGPWRYRLNTDVAGLLRLEAEEVVALERAAEVLERENDRTGARDLRTLRDKIKALVPAPGQLRLETDEEALMEAQGVAARPGPRPRSKPDVDATVTRAIKESRLLEIDYASRGDGKARIRRVAPLGILLSTRRYLVAIDMDAGDGLPRTYRMDAINDATVSATAFERPGKFRIKDFTRRAFGVFQDDSEYGEVVWRFSPHAAGHAREFVFHPDQTMTTEPDGSLTVRFNAAGHLEMCWHLYMWGDQVDVLAPELLRIMVENHRRSDFPALP